MTYDIQDAISKGIDYYNYLSSVKKVAIPNMATG